MCCKIIAVSQRYTQHMGPAEEVEVIEQHGHRRSALCIVHIRVCVCTMTLESA